MALRGLLLDLDGVFYRGNRVLPGAPEVARWAIAEALPHLFVSNTTSRPRAALVAKLAGFGIAVAAERILTPPVAAVRWLHERGARRLALCVTDATRAEFAGFEAVDDGPVDAVVVGDLGDGWDFARLNRAFRQLMENPHPALIALGMTRYWRAEDGLRLDTAPFVVALEHASGVPRTVFGKPARAFFDSALATLGCDPREAAMVGDDIRGDVAGAQAAGLHGVLVRTGKFRPADLDGEIVPDAVLDSVADLPAWWLTRG
jgi:HAD superfamily hydrolase (TIGR01458 family)